MTPARLFSRQTTICFLLFSSLAIAVLQNVTVDDAVLTGAGVPQYLPNTSVWNIGNNCTGCFVQPDPSLAYNGTWHDMTYSSTNGYTQLLEFNFTGSALYIFFIIANTVPNAASLTAVDFLLDNVNVNSYTHFPDSSTNYLYNVPVYASGSLESGQHTMTVQPINSSNNVLVLFDYYVYSTTTSTNTTSSTSSLSQTASAATSSFASIPSTRQSEPIGAIVGGTVGGVAFLALSVAFVLCFRRYKKHGGVQPPVGREAVVDPYYVEPQARERRTPISPTVSQNKLVASSPLQSSAAPSSTAPPSTAPPSSAGDAASFGQVTLLREVRELRAEVARLQDHMYDPNRNVLELLPEEAPPEYS